MAKLRWLDEIFTLLVRNKVIYVGIEQGQNSCSRTRHDMEEQAQRVEAKKATVEEFL